MCSSDLEEGQEGAFSYRTNQIWWEGEKGETGREGGTRRIEEAGFRWVKPLKRIKHGVVTEAWRMKDGGKGGRREREREGKGEEGEKCKGETRQVYGRKARKDTGKVRERERKKD